MKLGLVLSILAPASLALAQPARKPAPLCVPSSANTFRVAAVGADVITCFADDDKPERCIAVSSKRGPRKVRPPAASAPAPAAKVRGKGDMKDDLRFREGKPVTGGREQWSKQGLEYGAAPSTQNFFQARYAVRHWWTGPVKCKNPQRGVWGGPPDGNYQPTLAAGKLAFAPRGKLAVASMVNRDLWEIGLKRQRTAPAPAPGPTATPPKPSGVKAMGFGALGTLLLLGLGVTIARRRRV